MKTSTVLVIISFIILTTLINGVVISNNYTASNQYLQNYLKVYGSTGENIADINDLQAQTPSTVVSSDSLGLDGLKIITTPINYLWTGIKSYFLQMTLLIKGAGNETTFLETIINLINTLLFAILGIHVSIKLYQLIINKDTS